MSLCLTICLATFEIAGVSELAAQQPLQSCSFLQLSIAHVVLMLFSEILI